MTESTATRVATILLAAAGVGVMYYVARTPRLRRLAIDLGKKAALTWGPVWLAGEVKSAWKQAGRHPA
jgi:hypothetical protein